MKPAGYGSLIAINGLAGEGESSGTGIASISLMVDKNSDKDGK
jgi:hypothetical protein